jgi:hypothetical protein
VVGALFGHEEEEEGEGDEEGGLDGGQVEALVLEMLRPFLDRFTPLLGEDPLKVVAREHAHIKYGSDRSVLLTLRRTHREWCTRRMLSDFQDGMLSEAIDVRVCAVEVWLISKAVHLLGWAGVGGPRPSWRLVAMNSQAWVR